MPTITATTAPTTDLYYVDIGEGQPVVLIHGWPLSHRMWASQIDALVAAGYRCIAYDRRGFGDSGRPDGGYDYETFSADLNDVLTHLDLQNVVLVGFSMGGGEVARYIGRYGTQRVAKAMLLGAVPPFLLQTSDNPDGAPQEVFDGMIAGVQHNREGFLDGFLQNFFNTDVTYHDAPSDLVPSAKAIAMVASLVGTAQCITAFGSTDFRADLAKFDVPTLVVHGNADRIVPFGVSGKKSAALIAGSRLEVLDGAPHGFAGTHAAALNTLMLDFLSE